MDRQKFTNKVITKLSQRGYKVFSDLPIVENNLSFIALAPNEIFLLGEVLPGYCTEKDLKEAFVKLLCARYAIANLFIDTLEDIQIHISMVLVCSRKPKLSPKIQGAFFYSGIQLLVFNSNKDSYNSLPKIDIDLPDDEKEDFDAYVGFIETVIRYLTCYPIERNINVFGNVFSNSDIDTEKQQDEPKMLEIENEDKSRQFKSPHEMAEEVKKWIIGQDNAIENVAIPFFQHIESRRTGTTCVVKTPFILIGNTGTGKTEILRRFGQICNVPIIRINTADIQPNGWRGNHISDFIGYNINNESDLERMKYAVLVFNEFDKVTHYNDNEHALGSATETAWKSDIQREFLRFFDIGYELVINKQDFPENIIYHLPVDNLLLCFDGAFSGMEEIIKNRLKSENYNLGFVQPDKKQTKNDLSSSLLRQITVADLRKWGYSPELLDRINTFITMNPMSEEMAYTIITTSSDSIINAHKMQCLKYGIKLEFTDGAYRKIAKMATELGLGFRSVKNILAKIMKDIYYDCDKYKNTTIIVDEEFIECKFGQDR